MAAGSIILDLLMRTGSFETDTERARKKLEQFRKEAVETGKEVALAFAGVAAGAVAAIAALDGIAGTIAEYQDLADRIGDSAVAVSGLQLAADQSGTSLDTVASASIKLTAALSKTDDEAKGVGAALAAINIPIEDFKRLDPVTQLEQVAAGLAKFEDGAAKTAVAVALFGKSGAELIPFLNDLADSQGRNVRLTAEQIDAADRFSKRLATMRSEASSTAKVFAADLFPAANVVLDAFDDMTEKIGGAAAISGFVRRELAGLVEALSRIGAGLYQAGAFIGAYAATAQRMLAGDFAGARAIGEQFRADIAQSDRAVQGFIARVQSAAQNANALNVNARLQSDPRELARRGRPVEQRAALEFSGVAPPKAAKSGGGGKSGSADRISEAERYLEGLQKEIDKTTALTRVEQALADVRSGRLGKVSPDLEQRIVGVAQQIDLSKRLESQLKAEDQQLQDLRRSQEEVEAVAKRFYDQTRTPQEQLNDQLEEQARLLERIGPAYQDTYNRVIGALSLDFNKSKGKAEELDDVGKQLGLTFGSAFEDAVVEGAKFRDLLDGLEKDVLRIATRKLITEPFAAFLTDGLKGKGGSDIFSGILSTFGSFFGGFKAVGGDLLPDRDYIVGENGPERFRPRTAGLLLPASVTAAAGAGRSQVVNITINMPAGATRQTASQAGAEIARKLAIANLRNN